MPDRYGTFGSYLADSLADNRAFAKQYTDDAALKAYAAHPNDPAALAQMTARNPGLLSQITNARTGALRAQTEADQIAAAKAARIQAAGFLGGGPQGGSPTSIAAGTVSRPGASLPGGSPQAGTTSANGEEITVTANAPQLTREQQVAQLYAQDPATAEQFLKLKQHIGTLDEQGRKSLADKADTFGNAVPALQKMPYEQRKAAIEAYRPTLLQHGWTENEISDFDPSDQNLSLLLGQAVGAKDILAAEDRDASRDLTRRGQDIGAANAARSAAVSMRGQNMTDARARQSLGIQAAGVGKQQRSAETGLRKEFESREDVKAFRDTRAAFQQVRQLSKSENGQTDNALVYSYMKMLDPGSVVREGEFALAAKAAGLPDRITNYFGRLDNGQFLNPKMRQEIASAAGQVYKQRRDTYNQTAAQFRDYAQGYGVDPERVAKRYVPKPSAAPAGKWSGWKIERGN